MPCHPTPHRPPFLFNPGKFLQFFQGFINASCTQTSKRCKSPQKDIVRFALRTFIQDIIRDIVSVRSPQWKGKRFLCLILNNGDTVLSPVGIFQLQRTDINPPEPCFREEPADSGIPLSQPPDESVDLSAASSLPL